MGMPPRRSVRVVADLAASFQTVSKLPSARARAPQAAWRISEAALLLARDSILARMGLRSSGGWRGRRRARVEAACGSVLPSVLNISRAMAARVEFFCE